MLLLPCVRPDRFVDSWRQFVFVFYVCVFVLLIVLPMCCCESRDLTSRSGSAVQIVRLPFALFCLGALALDNARYESKSA